MKKIIVLIIALASVALAADKPDCHQLESNNTNGSRRMKFGCLKPADNVDVITINIATLRRKLIGFSITEYRTDSTMTHLTYGTRINDNTTDIDVAVYDKLGIRTKFEEWNDARSIEHHYKELHEKYNFITAD